MLGWLLACVSPSVPSPGSSGGSSDGSSGAEPTTAWATQVGSGGTQELVGLFLLPSRKDDDSPRDTRALFWNVQDVDATLTLSDDDGAPVPFTTEIWPTDIGPALWVVPDVPFEPGASYSVDAHDPS